MILPKKIWLNGFMIEKDFGKMILCWKRIWLNDFMVKKDFGKIIL